MWINPGLLESVFYLYHSKTDAETGVRAGGSGFFVSMPSIHADHRHIYAVTNKHVVVDAASCVLRINTKDMRFDVLTSTPDQWETIFEDDLAVLPLSLSDAFEVWAVPIEMFLEAPLIGLAGIGPGDNVALIGRFVSHDGKIRNKPLVRFGNIA